MAGIRIQGQTGRSQPASAVCRAVSTADRLANLVRCNGVSGRISMDAAFRLETFAQRSRHALAPGQQSVSHRAASLHSRAAVSLSFRADWRSGMVETGTSWRMAAGALDQRRGAPPHDRSDELARLEAALFQS